MESIKNDDLYRLIDQTIRGNRIKSITKDTTTEELIEELGIYFRELEYQNEELRRTQVVLENTKAEFIDLFNSAPVGYIVYDSDLKIYNTNKYFENLCKKNHNQLKGEIITKLISEISQDAYYFHVRDLEKHKENISSEIYINQNGNNIPVRIDSNIKTFNGRKYYMSAVTNIIKEKTAEIELTKSHEDLKRFASHIQTVREDERVLLARDIHDDLGQILIAMKIDLGLLKNQAIKMVTLDDSEDLTNKFENLKEMLNRTLLSARRIMTELRPEVLDMIGFSEALNQHLKSFSERYSIKTNFENKAQEIKINSQQSVALYRIAQESLNNIAKHAKATNVFILIAIDNKKLVFEIKDDGIGFDVNEKKHFDSFGLLGIKERVLLLEGDLKITSTPGQGTQIQVKIPL